MVVAKELWAMLVLCKLPDRHVDVHRRETHFAFSASSIRAPNTTSFE